MPSRAIDSGFVAGVNVTLGTAAPALAARDQFRLDHALGAEIHRDFAIQALRWKRHEHALAIVERGQHFRPVHDLREVRRSNLFFAFRHEYQVDGQLASRAADRVQRGQESGLRTFLVGGAAPDQNLAQPRLVH